MNAAEPLETPIRLLIAEDHEFTRTGLIYAFKSRREVEIVGEAENGRQAVHLAKEKQPHAVLMDIGMPELDGIEATQQIKAFSEDIKIVVLTSRQFSEEIYAALASGADAYCMKDIPTERLVQVLETVREGAVWLDPDVARIVASALPSAERNKEQAPSKQSYNTQLTEREQEVLTWIAQGKSNKDIADGLCLSIHTVKSHVRSLIQKLSVDSRTQAALKAINEGLVPGERFNG